MKRIFDPVVSRIVALVKDQVRDVERKGEVVKVGTSVEKNHMPALILAGNPSCWWIRIVGIPPEAASSCSVWSGR